MIATMETRALSRKIQRFVDEYIIDLNATKAAERAGYKGGKHTLEVQGSRLLSKAEVQTQIEIAMRARRERNRATADRVVEELEYLALYDPASFTRVRKPTDIEDLPAHLRRAIVGWTYTKSGKFVLEFAKTPALTLLGKHHKIYTDRVQMQLTMSLEQILTKSWEEPKPAAVADVPEPAAAIEAPPAPPETTTP